MGIISQKLSENFELRKKLAETIKKQHQ